MTDTTVGVAYLDIVPRLAQNFASQVDAQASAFSKGAIKTGAILTATVTAPIVAVGTLAVKSFEQSDMALKQFAASTGIHGRKLDQFGAQMRKTFSNATFANLDYPAIEAAMAKVAQRFDLTGGAAGRLTRKFLAIGKVTGEDVPTLIDTTSQALKAFNIPAKNTSDLLDFIYKASQKSGIPFSELVSGAIAAQVPIRAMNLTFKQGIALLAQLNAVGVSPTALKGISTFIGKLTAPDVVTKLQTAIAAARATTRDAKGNLSPASQLKVTTLQGELALAQKAKQDPLGALQAVFQQIKDAPTRNAALGIAAKDFGSRTGGALVTPIRTGALNPQAFVRAVNQGDATPGGDAKSLVTFSDSVTAFKRKIENALIPLGRAIVNVFKSLKPQIKEFVGFIKDLAKRFADLDPTVKKVVVVVALLAAALGPTLIVLGTIAPVIGAVASGIAAISLPVAAVVVGIAALAAGFIWLYKNTTWFAPAMKAIGHAITQIPALVTPALQLLKQVVTNVLGFIVHLWDYSSKGIIHTAKAVWQQVSNIVKAALKIVQGIVAFVMDAIHGKWDKAWKDLVKVVHNVWKLIKSAVVLGFRLVWELLKNAGPLLWKAAQAYWNGILLAFNKIWQLVWAAVKKIPGIVVNLLAGAVHLLFKAAAALWGVLLRAAKAAGVGLVNWFKKLPGNIVKAVGSVARTLVNLGGKLIAWIVQGIEHAPQSIGASLLSHIPSWARGAVTAVAEAGSRVVLPRAAGGPVLAGQSYLVGENAPELLTMGASGGYVSNIKGGGGVTNNTFHIRSHDPVAVRHEILRALNQVDSQDARHQAFKSPKYVG